MHQRYGFTLSEILIGTGLLAIFAVILLPLLVNPHARTYDAATQRCLQEVSARQRARAEQSPFEYDPAFKPTSISYCSEVGFTFNTNVTPDSFVYEARHNSGANTYKVSAGTGVVKVN